MTSAVALLLDREFGHGIMPLAGALPVWVIASEANDRAVMQARRQLGSAANITTIEWRAEEEPAELLLRALYAIDEHHGPDSTSEPYQRVLVIGGSPDWVTAEMMASFGFRSVSTTASGFSIEKSASSASYALAK